MRVFSSISRRSSRQSEDGDDQPSESGFLKSQTKEHAPNQNADPEGLTVLYDPPNMPTADIILVHGLGGTSRQTWTKDGDPDLFWPQKWLPSEPDISTARILTFGYNSQFLSGATNSLSRITDFAKRLLFDMRFGKDDEMNDLIIGKVPIIFIVHSMGGLVFKKAYVQAVNNEEYKEMIASVHAVLFLSTPHRGTNLAELLNRVLSVSILGLSRKQYVAELTRNSPALEDLNEDFRNFASKMQIFSFYETLRTRVGPTDMMILEKDSSILGYPGEISQPLDADHHDVCKFSSQSDPNYKSVRSVLKTLVSSYGSEGVHNANTTIADMQLISTLLSVSSSPDEDHNSLRQRWRVGTCQALVKNSTFISWSETSKSSALWVHAKPGSGKSVKASFVINYLAESDCCCQYFFHKYEDVTKRSPSSLLRSLAYQIARGIPAFRERLCCLGFDGLRLEKADACAIWQKLFVSILFNLDLGKHLYWVIDGLDESDSFKTVTELLPGMASSKTPIHVIVMSRHTPAIATAFEKVAKFTKFSTLCADNDAEDIRVYATSEFEYMQGSTEFRQSVINEIVERSEGNFLWAHLVLKEILQCHSPDEIKRVLQEIPSGMESLYHRMEAAIARLERASEKFLARMILTWATYARRPLNDEELLQALQPEFPTVLNLQHTVNQVCGQFVVIDNSRRATLVHHSAREYLTSAQDLPFGFAAPDAHEQILRKCISVFLDRNVRSRLSATPVPTFYSYAATSWAYHLSHSSAESDDVLSLIVGFFQSPCVLPWIQVLAVLGDLKVFVSASQALTSFVQKRRQHEAPKMPLLHRVRDAQLLETWAIDLLKIVGKFGSHLVDKPTAIYRYIPQFCPQNSALHRQFAGSSSSALDVSGISNTDWDDCLARTAVAGGRQALKVICSGGYLAVQTSASAIIIWDSSTFEEIQTLSHNENIFAICFSNTGDKLASYGSQATRIWSVSTGRELSKIVNRDDARPLRMVFAHNDSMLMMGMNVRRVETLVLDDPERGWHNIGGSAMQEEVLMDGAFLNSPTALAFNSDASLVAVAYRGFPLTVAAINPSRLINRCRRRSQRGSSLNPAWTGVNRVTWHPRSGEVLGIYVDGPIFKWHPFDETHHELKADLDSMPSAIVCSADGLVFATCDVRGSVKLYSFQHFVLVYQLSSEDIVTDICFGADSRRFFDIRGSYCNAWEPNALGSLTSTYVASEAWVEASVPVTALWARPGGSLFCVATDDGVVELYDVVSSSRREVGRCSADMSIDHLVWGDDGRHFAYADICRRVTVKSVEPLQEEKGSFRWNDEILASFKVGSMSARIRQLLLNFSSSHILIVTVDSAQAWDIRAGSEEAGHISNRSESPLYFANHPSKADHILGFSARHVVAFSWSGLKEVCRWQLQSTDGRLSGEKEDRRKRDSGGRTSPDGTRCSLGAADEVIDQVTVTQGKEYVILVTRGQHVCRHRRSHIRIIEMASLVENPESREDSGSLTDSSVDVIDMPEHVAAAIERPVDVLGKDLVFVDRSLWVCTWRLQHHQKSLGSGLAKALPSNSSIRKHFFLPRDWVTLDSLRMCQVTLDGTFLCPRKHEVAVIKSSLGSDW